MNTSLLEKATLGRDANPTLVCAVTLVLIFLCGAAAGALAMNLGVHSRLHQPSFDSPTGKALYFERLNKELDLTPAQADQLRSILNDFWDYYRTVLTDGKVRVEQVLNPEQRRKFERLLQEAQQK
jgi:Spy/CpxP family protein refolding chaperone